MEEKSDFRRGGFGGGSGGDRNRKKKRTKKKMVFRKRRPPADMTFDYKDLNSMLPFLTEEGRIVAARVSGLSALQQRKLTQAVKRARHLSFISPVYKNWIG